MGSSLLRDVLRSWDSYELDDDIYVPAGTRCELDTEVTILPYDRTRPRHIGNLEYLLSFEQVRDVVEGLEQHIGRTTSLEERLAAILHYAEYDAFIDPANLAQIR
jgi:hypothetical protein